MYYTFSERLIFYFTKLFRYRWGKRLSILPSNLKERIVSNLIKDCPWCVSRGDERGVLFLWQQNSKLYCGGSALTDLLIWCSWWWIKVNDFIDKKPEICSIEKMLGVVRDCPFPFFYFSLVHLAFFRGMLPLINHETQTLWRQNYVFLLTAKEHKYTWGSALLRKTSHRRFPGTTVEVSL